MTPQILQLTEKTSGLAVHIELATRQAPANAAFLWEFLSQPRDMPALHAIWTGPEISCPIPSSMLDANAALLPPENATVTPQPGDFVLACVPARMWGGNPQPIFDLGLFYGPGARMLFPIGWLPGSVVGKVAPAELAHLATACTAIRNSGACTLRLSRT